MRVLVVNAGSSSLKLRVLDAEDRTLAQVDIRAERGVFDQAEAERALERVGEVDAVGYRVVHGGERFVEPARVTPEVVEALHDLIPLAPLQQPSALRGIALVGDALPRTPAVACFDTAFHRSLDEAARTYALPEEWRRRYGVRRFGFHGLSHAWAARRARELLGDGARMLVSCHLGSGASLAAIAGGRSVDTTMGFTPLEGVVMATRSGSVDPGMLLWLQTEAGLDAAEMLDALDRRSGLLALCGTSDMREVVARVTAGDGQAALAFEICVRRVAAAVAAMAVSLGGMGAMVFTGGVGENSAEVREAVCARLRFLGVELDPASNRSGTGDRPIGPSVLVIASREDRTIAEQVRRLLA